MAGSKKDTCLSILVKVRGAAWVGSGEGLFLPGTESLMWSGCETTLTGPCACNLGPQVVALTGSGKFQDL